jgi:hypothetical protein
MPSLKLKLEQLKTWLCHYNRVFSRLRMVNAHPKKEINNSNNNDNINNNINNSNSNNNENNNNNINNNSNNINK